MLNKISSNLAAKILKHVKKTNYSNEVYAYGIEIIISTSAEIFSIIFLALILSSFREGMLFILIFFSLRIFSGGYHAETYRKCFIITIFSFYITLLISKALTAFHSTQMLYCMLFLVCPYIIFRAPVINKNQPLNNKKILKSNKMTSITLIFCLLIISRLHQYAPVLFNMSILTICLVAIFMLIGNINVPEKGGKAMVIIAKLIEICARFGAGCASVGACYQPKVPTELM